MAEDMGTWASTIKDKLKLEIGIGGNLTNLLCPLCGLPRCQRSDYIRCQRCGVNWLPGEAMDKNPTIDRFREMAALQPKKAAKS